MNSSITVDDDPQKKLQIRDIFEYTYIDKVNYGNCKLCGFDKNQKYINTIKMTGSNTSGLISH